MWKRPILVALCVLCLGPAWSARAAVDPTLVGWWWFDEGAGTAASDSSSYKNNGTLMNGAQWGLGHFGKAVQFDGVDDWVQVPHNASLCVTTGVTVMAWVYAERTNGPGTEGYQGVVGKGNAPRSYSLYTTTAGPLHFSTGPGGAYIGSTSSTPLPTRQWAHVAVKVEGGQHMYFINGVAAGVGGSGVVLPGTGDTSVLHIGRTAEGATRSFQGRIDDVRVYNRALSLPEIQKIMTGSDLIAGSAKDPSPADGAADVPRDTSLAWMPGPWAVTHDVYLGGAFADVNSASRTNKKDVLASQSQTPTTYQPSTLLDYGTTYYWRVDEVNKPSDNTIFKGTVWSFTVEPYAYPVKPVAVTASSFQTGMGPEKTIDGSGMTGDQHGTEPTTMWLSAGVQPNWIQYEFDQAYKLHELWVWNSNQLIESFLGFGAKSVKVETSTDGATWTALADVPEFTKAPGAAGYAANTKVSLGGVSAKYVKLTINATWGGVAPQTGLAEVRFFYAPIQAFGPQPTNAATGISVDADLNWRPGREAASHTVFFGTDQAAVAAGTAPAVTLTERRYNPASMALGTTYYWRVDEVGATGTYPGTVWSFTTQEFKVVEDFESYTDVEGNRIYEAWIDGFGTTTNGSQVGNLEAPFAEQTIVHGGKQSMPLAYNNAPALSSEATLTLAPAQDWTARGIKSLSLWFHGTAGNGGQLYVKINSTKVLYDGDAADLARAGWQVWNIDLSKAGNVSSVRSLTIGIEGAGAKGLLYLDDIRLYPKVPQYVTPVAPAATNLAAHYTLDEGSGTRVGDSSGNNRHGTTNGDPQWVAGKIGGALRFNGATQYVETNYTENLAQWTVCAWVTSPAAPAATAATGPVHREKNYQINWNHGTATFRGAAAMAIGGTWYAAKFDTLSGDTWYHLTATFDGTAFKAYTNGVLTTTTVASGVTDAEVGTLKLGRHSTAAQFFAGTVDDVRIYSRPLSAAEVAGLAGQTKARHQPF